MLLSFNFKQIEDKAFSLPYNDRGFNYGDGLFETMIYNKQKIYFLRDHLNRLKEGMKIFGFEGVSGIKKDLIEQQIFSLIHNNKLSGRIKIRMQVWRRQGGLYSPQNNHFNILISVFEAPQAYTFKTITLGFSEKVKLAYSSFSKYKTTNALPYIIASIEKEKRGYDELVLINEKGVISECTANNIFWVKNNTIYTPSLKSGCVEGIARKRIIKKFLKAGYTIKRVMHKKRKLFEADSVFLTNALGIKHVKSLHNHHYKVFEKVDEFFH